MLKDAVIGLLTHTDSSGAVWVRQDDVLACIAVRGQSTPDSGLIEKLEELKDPFHALSTESRWVIQARNEAIDECIEIIKGDASNRKTEGDTEKKVAATSPATNPDEAACGRKVGRGDEGENPSRRGESSEIPVNEDERACWQFAKHLAHGVQCVRGPDDYLVWKECEQLIAYIDAKICAPLPEPVVRSVSLEKCAIAANTAILASPSTGFDRMRKITKAVLDAAGVKYVD